MIRFRQGPWILAVVGLATWATAFAQDVTGTAEGDLALKILEQGGPLATVLAAGWVMWQRMTKDADKRDAEIERLQAAEQTRRDAALAGVVAEVRKQGEAIAELDQYVRSHVDDLLVVANRADASSRAAAERAEKVAGMLFSAREEHDRLVSRVVVLESKGG